MKRILPAFLLLIASSASRAQTELIDIGTTILEATTIYTSTDIPWELKFGPGDSLWMTTRPGRVLRVHPGNGGATVLLNHVPNVWQVSESGMLGMEFDPQFATNRFVYIVYNYTSGGLNRERLSRFTYSGNSLGSEQVLLDGGLIAANSIHNGSRLALLPDNTLLMTTGDAANTANAQNMSSLNGKILRLNLDGSIPANNPFPGSYIYSFGHRNPQGLMVHSNGRVYETEHGPSNNDEFQVIEAGRNYGWPNVEGFCDNDKAGETTFCTNNNVKEPLASWNVAPGGTWAPNDLVWYGHAAIPEFQNSFLVTFLKTNKVRRIRMNAAGDAITGQQDFLVNEWGRLRDITVSPSGEIFLATNTSPFRIIRLRNSAVVPVKVRNTRTVCHSEMVLSWETEQEMNNRRFIIYGGDDAGAMTLAGYVDSRATGGNSNIPVRYEFRVPAADASRIYRLQSEDIDGRIYDHGIVQARCNERNVRIENGRSFLRVVLPAGGERMSVQVMDGNGRMVYNGHVMQEVTINTASWAGGIYYVRVIGADGRPRLKEKIMKVQ